MAKKAEAETIEAPAKVEGLAVGRIVHFVDNGAKHNAAVITWVWDESGTVNLFVFDNGVTVPFGVVRSVRYDENLQPLSWHFPERA